MFGGLSSCAVGAAVAASGCLLPPPFVNEPEPLPIAEHGPEVYEGREDWLDVGVGESACGLTVGGEVYCDGRLAWAGPASQLEVGQHACALTAGGDLWCNWLPAGAPDVEFEAVGVCRRSGGCGGAYGCATSADGGIACWPIQPGNPWIETDQSWIEIDVGPASSPILVGIDVCWLDPAGAILCATVGSGPGSIAADRPGGDRFVDLTPSSAFACATGMDGHVSCFGDPPPVDATATVVAAGEDVVCVVPADSPEVRCFDADGSYTALEAPDVVGLAVGDGWGVALRSGGAVASFDLR